MKYVEELINRYPCLCDLQKDVESAVRAIVDCHSWGGKILIAGNGGSAADAEHISGELLKGFITKRPPDTDELSSLKAALGEDAHLLQRGVSAIPLSSLSASLSAFANDVSPRLVFAQLVYALGRAGDVLVCLSTSGNSENVVAAARVARTLGIHTVALTGRSGGKLAEICDITVNVPESETYKVQELHLPVYHAICAEVEEMLF